VLGFDAVGFRALRVGVLGFGTFDLGALCCLEGGMLGRCRALGLELLGDDPLRFRALRLECGLDLLRYDPLGFGALCLERGLDPLSVAAQRLDPLGFQTLDLGSLSSLLRSAFGVDPLRLGPLRGGAFGGEPLGLGTLGLDANSLFARDAFGLLANGSLGGLLSFAGDSRSPLCLGLQLAFGLLARLAQLLAGALVGSLALEAFLLGPVGLGLCSSDQLRGEPDVVVGPGGCFGGCPLVGQPGAVVCPSGLFGGGALISEPGAVVRPSGFLGAGALVPEPFAVVGPG